MVFWLLSLLANRDKEEMSRTLLALSSSQDSCLAMRKSGCVPLLVQILHEDPPGGPDPEEPLPPRGPARVCSREARSRAGAALHNIIYSQQDEGQARREMRVLQMLEQIRTYSDSGWDWMETRAGPLGSASSGVEGQKLTRSQSHTISGSQGQRVTRSQDQRVTRSQGKKVTASQGHRISGFQGLRVSVSQGHRVRGSVS